MLDHLEKGVHVRFEAAQVADPIAGKGVPDELSAVVPLRPVLGEYAIPEEVTPVVAELVSLPKVVELSDQDRPDVLRIRREDDALVENADLGGPESGVPKESIAPVRVVLPSQGGFDACSEKVEP